MNAETGIIMVKQFPRDCHVYPLNKCLPWKREFLLQAQGGSPLLINRKVLKPFTTPGVTAASWDSKPPDLFRT